ncbi:MAG: DUF177 domain-containing protein [Clostridium sp.]
MKILFVDLLSKKDRKKVLELSFEMNSFEFEGEQIKALEPVQVVGSVIPREELLVLTANVKTKLELTCSRCLDTFIYPIDIDIEERFTNNEDFQSNEEIVFVKGDSIDISGIVESSIASTLPIKRLCTDDCRGLCHECGKNLNKEACQCDNVDVDLRFEKLKELFGQ